MNLTVRKRVFTIAGALGLVGLAAVAYGADQGRLLLPPHKFPVPKFGFESFNIRGVGERVTHVHWGGLASRIGLEPGDTILRVNNFPLHYHGAWDDAVREAMASGGSVRLRIRDSRTGRVVMRNLYLGGHGPVTPKFHDHDNHHAHDHHHGHHHDGHHHDGHQHGDSKKGGPFKKFGKELAQNIGKDFGKKLDGKFGKKFDDKFAGPKELNKKFAGADGERD